MKLPSGLTSSLLILGLVAWPLGCGGSESAEPRQTTPGSGGNDDIKGTGGGSSSGTDTSDDTNDDDTDDGTGTSGDDTSGDSSADAADLVGIFERCYATLSIEYTLYAKETLTFTNDTYTNEIQYTEGEADCSGSIVMTDTHTGAYTGDDGSITLTHQSAERSVADGDFLVVHSADDVCDEGTWDINTAVEYSGTTCTYSHDDANTWSVSAPESGNEQDKSFSFEENGDFLVIEMFPGETGSAGGESRYERN